jgi:cation:H+ antiporter
VKIRIKSIRIILSFFLLIPFLIGYVIGLDSFPVLIVTLITSLAVISSGYLLGLGTDRLQFVVSQALALALLAVIQTLPEYAVEAVLSYTAAFKSEILHYVTANLTGANRLLIGLGWPVTYLISYFAGGRKKNAIELDNDQSVEVVFLGLATFYSFVIFIKGTLNIFDGIILTFIFLIYLGIAVRFPPKSFLENDSGIQLWAVPIFLLVGTAAVFFSAEPFVNSMLQAGKMLGIDDYFLIQWLAPVVSEAPEAVTVVYWAAKSGMGKTAIANLISSKINQWTLLFAVIPLIYTFASGNINGIQLTKTQGEEILLTATQSLFGFLCLSDLKLSMPESISLFFLFSIQLFLPETRVFISMGYVFLCAVRFVTEKERTKAFRIFSVWLRENFFSKTALH